MADAFYDYNNGSSGNSGLTELLPKATRQQAVAVAGAGDNCYALDGIHVHESSHFDFDEDVKDRSLNFRGATLRSGGAESVRVARFSSGLAVIDNPIIMEGFVFDAPGSNSGSGVQRAFEFPALALDLTVQFHNCEFINGSTYGLFYTQSQGRLELVNCKFSGTLPSGAGAPISLTTSLSSAGNQVVDIQGIEFDLTEISSDKSLLVVQQVGTPSNTLDAYIKSVRGTLAISGATTNVTFIKCQTKDTINIANCNFTVNANDNLTDTDGSVVAILAIGNSSGNESSDVNITNNIVNYFSPAGFALSYGQSTVDGHITGGLVAGNSVTGKYYALDTPHNILMGQGTAGDCKGNFSRDGFVGILLSITDSCNCTGNTVLDCYGPSLYAKGTTAATVKDNICMVTGKYTQRNLGILSVAPQGATNTTAVTFQENLVIVQDITKIHSLAYIEDASQACTFIRNTYILPDTVDIDTAALFSYESGLAGQAANNTLAEWNAQSEVTDDVIITMPVAQIEAMIAANTPATGSGTGSNQIISNNIIS